MKKKKNFSCGSQNTEGKMYKGWWTSEYFFTPFNIPSYSFSILRIQKYLGHVWLQNKCFEFCIFYMYFKGVRDEERCGNPNHYNKEERRKYFLVLKSFPVYMLNHFPNWSFSIFTRIPCVFT